MEANNMKAMREAVDRIRNIANSALTALYIGNDASNFLWDIIRECKAALAAPPRNCDRFVSSEEALLAYSATYLDDDDARPHYATLAHFLFAEEKGDAK